MKATKLKILDKALEMFNRQGSDNVTVRHISAELNMSHGNLCYHFPNVDAIITRLYYNLVDELTLALNAGKEKLMSQSFTLFWMFNTTEDVFNIFYKYKFFMLEFVSIMRRIKEVSDHYLILRLERKKQMHEILLLMKGHGYLVEEPIKGAFDNLVEHIMMMGDFWVSSAEILFKGTEKEKIFHYSKVFNNLVVPYFSEKAITEYEQFYANKSSG